LGQRKKTRPAKPRPDGWGFSVARKQTANDEDIMTVEKGIEEPPGSRQLPLFDTIVPARVTDPLKVAVLANLKKNIKLRPDSPPDEAVEYDREETVEAIQQALRVVGHEAFLLEGDVTLLDTIRRTKPDFCFNLCEGLRGDARESHVPAILEMLGIPYTASKIMANAISLEKVIAKRIWRDRGLPTVPFQLFNDPEAPLRATLRFPLFVKPVREGSGKGVAPSSIVQNETDLRRETRRIVADYHQPALVESFLPGREFTVGFIGNPPMGRKRANPELYGNDGFHNFPVLEIDPTVGAGQGVYGAEAKGITPGDEGSPVYTCPADIPVPLQKEMQRLTKSAALSIGAVDCSRVDLRLDSEGHPYLLEINTLPGLTPDYSDLCLMSSAEGISYPVLINEILNLACERYGMSPEEPPKQSKAAEAAKAATIMNGCPK
jgi:D-alanine-D-alanine ligase